MGSIRGHTVVPDDLSAAEGVVFAVAVMSINLSERLLFRNLAHARDLLTAWAEGYNSQRPHSALGYKTPAGFALNLTTAIARPAARYESSARRAIAQPAPIGANDKWAPDVAG